MYFQEPVQQQFLPSEPVNLAAEHSLLSRPFGNYYYPCPPPVFGFQPTVAAQSVQSPVAVPPPMPIQALVPSPAAASSGPVSGDFSSSVHQPAYSVPHPLPWLLPSVSNPDGHEGKAKPSRPTLARQHALPFRMSVERNEEIKAAFDAFDIDGTGTVDYDCFMEALRGLGLQSRKSEIRSAMRDLGACPDGGTLTFGGFSLLLERVYGSREPMDTMIESYKLFDESGHGGVTMKDLRRIADSSGLDRISDNDLEQMVLLFDRDGDGEVDEEDFMHMLSTTSLL